MEKNRIPLVILKLGGSVITFKSELKKPNIDVIDRLSKEISEVINHVKLILIHGGGSFGHPYAAEYEIHLGFKDKSQLIGLAQTRIAMEELNQIIVNKLIEHGIPAISIQPSACIIAENDEIKSFNIDPLKMSLELGYIPVLYGDAVFDLTKGFTIISGDKIASYLAIKFNAFKIVFGCDVDGIYTSNPKRSSNAKLIKRLSISDAKKILSSLSFDESFIDVTGGMKNKLVESIKAVSHGCEVLIVNALKPNYIKRAILGESIICTRIVR